MGDKWPAASEILKAVSIPTADQQNLMAAIDQAGGKIDAVVADWIANNKSVWSAWVAARK